MNQLNNLWINLCDEKDIWKYILTCTATFTCATNSLINFDELTFDLSLNFPHYIQFMKVKMRSKVSLSNFYDPMQGKTLTSATKLHDDPEFFFDDKRCVVPHHILVLTLAHSLNLFLKLWKNFQLKIFISTSAKSIIIMKYKIWSGLTSLQKYHLFIINFVII